MTTKKTASSTARTAKSDKTVDKAAEKAAGKPPKKSLRVIKKYPNRRLYDTDTSSYITLAEVKRLVMKSELFMVVDAKTNDDLTRSILLQIILEEETGGAPMFTEAILANIIRFYGNSMQGMLPQFLEASMDNFRTNQKQVQDAIEAAVTAGPFGQIAKQNIEFMRTAREALMPNLSSLTGKKPERTENIDDLKRQMAALQAKIDQLSGE